MGDGLFGNPITNATLEGMPDYEDNRNIDRKDRARVALNMRSSEEKSVRAVQYLQTMKDQCDGELGGTLCLLYNATGDPIRYVTHYDWGNGHPGPTPYPMEIANGQWAAFLHVPLSRDKPYATGAIVYGGKDPRGVDCDWMVSWDNPTDKINNTPKIYSEIREKNHFLNPDYWPAVYNKMQVSGICHDSVKDVDNQYGCSLSVSIGSNRFPILVAVFTLQDV
ncbi:23 kDa jasmonate-induced protein [Ziziphus jujuba]|uniref:23 kDa jasmonate-induced protein n=2 Tax=Ziziphus jujuba TaxID=326968 RepID=A0AC41ZNW6_ZIZJJ|nr:23 kDa jasmonate-induced protein [Ziziphus jujuba]